MARDGQARGATTSVGVIGVIGDYLVDRYWIGSSHRLSPEAPIPVVGLERTFDIPGGAGNVVQNLAALGGETLVVMQPSLMPIKNRLYVGSHQVARWDENDWADSIDADEVRALDGKIDKLVIADYGKGAITPIVLEAAWRLGLPTFVDTKADPALYAGFTTAIFPNASEYATYRPSYNLFERCIVTCGGEGLRVLEFGKQIDAVPAYCHAPVSVCGAGDTVTAAYAYAWPSVKAAQFASLAAAVAVGKQFTAVATLEEVEAMRRRVWRENEKNG